jgi:hypothetical protein
MGKERRKIFSLSLILLGSLFTLWLAGCAALPQKTLPPLDTSGPGWEVRQGQALWKPGNEDPEIAGDVVVSLHPSAGAYVQFSKTLPILSARLVPEGWEFHTIAEDKRYSGGGSPPNRIVWLQMLRVLDGQKISDRWSVAHPSDLFVSLQDSFKGEHLEIRFQPATGQGR